MSNKHESQFAEQGIYISHATPSDSDVVLGIPWFDPDDGRFYICTSLGPIVFTEYIPTVTAANVSIQNISTAAAVNVEDFINTANSTALVSGGVASDGGSGTIDITAGEIYIRATDSNIGELWSAEFAAVSGQALTDNSLNFIWAEYNSGAPQISVSTTPRSDVHRNVILAVVYREGTDVHISNVHIPSSQVSQLLAKRLVFVDAYSRQSGSVTSETGTRNIAVTAGAWWLALLEVATSALDTSSAGRFSYWHQNGGTWTEVLTQAAISNTQYNDISAGLANLSNNKYGVHWVYLSPESDNYHVVYGVADYTLTDAEEAIAPGTLPPWFNSFHVTLIAKIVIKKDASVFTTVQNPFDVQFGVGIATNHDDLGNLAWINSGHTGTANRLASFDGSGLAAELTIYNDAAAIAAVEGEATLDLAGDVTIDGDKSLLVDVINEKDSAAGVTVEGVLLKDSAIAGAAVPSTHAGTAHHSAESAASTSAQGIVELSIASENDTGTDATRAVTPDSLAGSIHGHKQIYIVVIANDTVLTTGDSKHTITIPSEFNGMNLIDADIVVYGSSSSGLPTVQLHNLDYDGGASDMLSTRMTIDTSELSSYTATTAPVIDGDKDDVATGDRIRIDVDVAGTGTDGLDVILVFGTP